MGMYAKLMARITESSLMEEEIPVRYCFVMLLAIADPKGCVIGTDVAISRRLNMKLEEFQACIAELMNPDPDSNSKEMEGRRVIISDGERGYFLVNYGKYRDTRDEEERREYMRTYMQNRRAEQVNSGKPGKLPLAKEEVEAPPNPRGGKVGEAQGTKKKRGNLPTTETAKRIATLFGRRLTTRWSDKEIRAYKAAGIVEEEDLKLLEGYYARQRARGDEGMHRRDLLTFLNNLPGELDRARAGSKGKCAPVAATEDPAGWREFLKKQGEAYKEFRFAMPFLKDDFRRTVKSGAGSPNAGVNG